jgi:hypothetical protein
MPGTEYDLEEAKMIQAGFLKIWEIFFHWFTWFFGANLLTMSWVVTGTHVHGAPLAALGLTWIACTVLGLIACYQVGEYTRRTDRRMSALVVDPNQLRDRSVSLMIALNVTRYASKATVAALAITIPAWLFLMYYFWNDTLILAG